MTVKELIRQLQSMPEDMSVHMAYQYGDYWRTTVAPEIDSVRSAEVVHSGYHAMDRIATDSDFDEISDARMDDDTDDDSDDDARRRLRRVVVLR
jgi:hypothetical protein